MKTVTLDAVANPSIGVLAIQGGFTEHVRVLEGLGARPVEVRRPGELEGMDGLVIPGGESTTIGQGLDQYGLREPIRAMAKAGTPVFGTCAGMILMARRCLDLLNIEVRRNAFGRQPRSFEADLEVSGLTEEPFRGVFIRAPWVEAVGDEVDVLARVEGHPVAVSQRQFLGCAFHPELTGDTRLHKLFLSHVRHGGRVSESKDSARPEGEGTRARRAL